MRGTLPPLPSAPSCTGTTLPLLYIIKGMSKIFALTCEAVCCDVWKLGICDSLLQKLVTVMFVAAYLLGSKSSFNSWVKS
jgi:hypothetical protein